MRANIKKYSKGNELNRVVRSRISDLGFSFKEFCELMDLKPNLFSGCIYRGVLPKQNKEKLIKELNLEEFFPEVNVDKIQAELKKKTTEVPKESVVEEQPVVEEPKIEDQIKEDIEDNEANSIPITVDKDPVEEPDFIKDISEIEDDLGVSEADLEEPVEDIITSNDDPDSPVIDFNKIPTITMQELEDICKSDPVDEEPEDKSENVDKESVDESDEAEYFKFDSGFEIDDYHIEGMLMILTALDYDHQVTFVENLAHIAGCKKAYNVNNEIYLDSIIGLTARMNLVRNLFNHRDSYNDIIE